jgi:hypothetical protein
LTLATSGAPCERGPDHIPPPEVPLPAPFLGRIRRPVRTSTAVVAAIAATATLTLTGPAIARSVAHAVNPPPTNPTSDSQIQNIDQVKTAIKGYYGDTVTNQVDPVPNNVDGGDASLHTFNPSGAYAQQVEGIADDAQKFLKVMGTRSHKVPGKKNAIVLDVDDTTLNTYNYEIYSNFVYNPTTNAAFVNAGVFPAVPGMPALVDWASHHGYKIYYLTGRPESQRAGTVANLVSAGYPAPDAAHLFMRNKDASAPAYLPCDATPPYCTTTQYKSTTRAHIEDLGNRIVANFGDQYSDLNGGHSLVVYKIPNPMYYLP